MIPSACARRLLRRLRGRHPGNAGQGWTRVGGSAGDWLVTAAGTKFFSQVGATSSTFRAAFSSGAPGAPWSGATSVSADVELNTLGISGQAALLCVRFVDISNFYCAALSPDRHPDPDQSRRQHQQQRGLPAGDQPRLDPAGEVEPERGGRPQRHAEQLNTRDTDPDRAGEWVRGGGDDKCGSIIRHNRGDATIGTEGSEARRAASPCPCPCPCSCPCP